MSTILTINTKEPKTRVEFSQPLQSISEIQLVDYDFPETYEKFETDQTIKSGDGSKTLLTVSAGGYSSTTMRTLFTISNLGITIHPSNDGYCISCKDYNAVVSRELAKTLGISSYLFKGKPYPVSWPSCKYHVYCDIGTTTSELGQIMTVDNKLVPTNLLAVVPSKSGIYSSCTIHIGRGPINYITLSVLDENGNNPSWGGTFFRINLRVTYWLSKWAIHTTLIKYTQY